MPNEVAYVLGFLLFMALSALIGFVIYHFAKKPDCPACPACPPTRLGLNYKTSDKDMSTLMNNIQKSITTLQSIGCKDARKDLADMRKSIMGVLELMPDIDCNAFLANFTKGIKAKVLEEVGPDAPDLTPFLNDMAAVFEQAIKMSCVKGKPDKERIANLVTGAFNAVCY